MKKPTAAFVPLLLLLLLLVFDCLPAVEGGRQQRPTRSLSYSSGWKKRLAAERGANGVGWPSPCARSYVNHLNQLHHQMAGLYNRFEQCVIQEKQRATSAKHLQDTGDGRR